MYLRYIEQVSIVRVISCELPDYSRSAGVGFKSWIVFELIRKKPSLH